MQRSNKRAMQFKRGVNRKKRRQLSAETLETRTLLTTVVNLDPAANSSTAPVTADVSVTFDQQVTAATDQTFVLSSSFRGRIAGPATSVTLAGPTASHSPTSNFLAGETIQATVTNGVTTAGGAATPHVWQFRVGTLTGSGEFVDSGQALGDPAANTSSYGVELGDLDGDGDLDAFVANNGSGNRVYLNDGGTFTDSGQSLGNHMSREVVLGDMDGDGDLDAVVSNVYGHENRVWQNNGSGVFSEAQSFTGDSTGLQLGDLDADGDLDAFVVHSGSANRVWRNSDGTLSDTGQGLGDHASQAVQLGDVDGDGDLDAFVTNAAYQPNRVWFNDGTGAFSDSGQVLGTHTSVAVDLGDVDGDGDLDAFVGNSDQHNRVYLNEGTGEFVDTGQLLARAGSGLGNRYSRTEWVELGDLDADGDLDLFAVNDNGGPNRSYLNDGTGIFTDTGQDIFANTSSHSMALGDVDGDGDLDAIVANDSTFVAGASVTRIWLNQNLTPSVSLAIDSATIAEDSGAATVSATLSAPHTQVVTVDLAFSGDATSSDDYTTSGSQIVIAAGATSGSISITAVQDATDEPDETVVVDISAVANAQEAGTQQVTTTILDDDEPIPVPDVTLSVDNAAIAEAAGVATFTANLSVPTTVPVTIDFGVSGTADASDYTVSATQIVVAAGATSGSITVTATQDEVDEPDETVIVDISNVTGGAESGTQQATTTITDDDEPVMPDVTLAVDQASIPEAAGVAVFTVTLSEATTAPVTVDVGLTGTADASDYTVSATQVVIAAGATSGTVTVTAVQDEVNEPDETVIVDITNVAGGNEAGDQQATTTIVDDDTPPSFRVTSLTATDSGFVIEFNSQLDGSALNMYDTQNAGLGAADVTVSGATSGNVVGSLVIGANSVEFIKSGDSLGADTYTVTLRSADDGFKDDGGALLDGDGDGAAGGDYSNSFTVDAAPEGARTISLPDFVRGPGQDVNLPADGTTGIPISISDGTNVRAADIRISYDPALLQITGATAPAGGTVVVNTTTPGLAILVYFATTALPAGPSDFINLQATVPTENASANYRSQQVLDVHDVIIGDGNDNEFPAVVDDAFHLNTYFADVSGNGRINASDAAQVARFAALIDSGFAASLNADPIIVGDISGNGRINAADASRVAQFAALIPVPEIPPVPGGILINGVPGPTFRVPEEVAFARVEVRLPSDDGLGFQRYADTLGRIAVGLGSTGAPGALADSALEELSEDELIESGLAEQLARDLLDVE